MGPLLVVRSDRRESSVKRVSQKRSSFGPDKPIECISPIPSLPGPLHSSGIYLTLVFSLGPYGEGKGERAEAR